MTYLEIIEWIEQNSIEVYKNEFDVRIRYFSSEQGRYVTLADNDLISLVLKIHNKELVNK